MELIYKSRIEAIAKRETNYNPIIENRIVDEARQNGPSFHRTSVFLSHSHLDAKIIKPVVVFLRSMGVDVYVDWMDETMSKATNGETAQKLKTKIKENEKFISVLKIVYFVGLIGLGLYAVGYIFGEWLATGQIDLSNLNILLPMVLGLPALLLFKKEGDKN